MEDDNIKAKRWSFCPTCHGRGMNLPKGCETCSSKGKVMELVLLMDLPKENRWEYRSLQAGFIQKQLNGKIKV